MVVFKYYIKNDSRINIPKDGKTNEIADLSLETILNTQV